MATRTRLPDLGHLTTESVNPRSENISTLDTAQVLQIINDEDTKIAACIHAQLPTITCVVDDIVPRLRKGGRVIYFGAGTSGRLGVLDASECLPTFNSEQFIGLMAGGDSALRRSAEGFEDSPAYGAADLGALEPPLDPLVDTAIGIASSGRTPYVKGALEYAYKLGCLTVCIVCVKPSELAGMTDNGERVVKHPIEIVVGPEVVTGSTRMKAGTATKLVLNMISTCSMIRLGKTYGNYMIDLRVSNTKLRSRAHRFIRLLCPSPPRSPEEIDALLASCSNSVKLAILVGRTGWDIDYAKAKLEQVEDNLNALLDIEPPDVMAPKGYPKDELELSPLFLCIDGGGSNTRAVVATADSSSFRVIGMGSSGPSNVSTLGIEAAISSIISAIKDALAKSLPAERRPQIFEKIWIACAGIDPVTRLSDFQLFCQRVTEVLRIYQTSSFDLKITSDAALLSSLLATTSSLSPANHAVSHPDSHLSSVNIDGGIVLISGTGSIGLLYSSTQKQIARAGGLGYLLDDEGSAFHLGRETLRWLFKHGEDADNSPSMEASGKVLRELVLTTYGIQSISDLIGHVYSSQADHSPKARIASLASGVLRSALEGGDPVAIELVRNEAKSLTSLVSQLLKPHLEGNKELVLHSHEGLIKVRIVCTGGMMHHPGFRRMVEESISSLFITISEGTPIRGPGMKVEIHGDEMIFVEEPAIQGVEALAAEWVRL